MERPAAPCQLRLPSRHTNNTRPPQHHHPKTNPITNTINSSASAAARPAAAASRRPAVAVRAALPDGNKPKFTLPSKVDLPKVDVADVSSKVSQVGAELAKTWEKTEDKPTAVFFGAVALVALVAASSVVDAVGSVPIIGDGIELIGIGATGFFAYKYLVWPSDREQLVADVKALFAKIGL